MENGETLTVVPVSSQSNNTQLSTPGQLNPNLHVLASSQANNGIQDLTAISHDTDGQDLETILREGKNISYQILLLIITISLFLEPHRLLAAVSSVVIRSK